MQTVGIIGGGITGCSLAYFLKDKFKIKLYEKNAHLGGLSKTQYTIENIPYQKGIHILHTNTQWILNLITKAGIKLDRVFYDVAINPLIDFKYYKFPFNEESIELMPWHWKEATLMDFDKTSGATGSNLKEEIVNFYGETIYDIFYKNYIKKLTNLDALDIDETSWFRKNLQSISNTSKYYKEDCYFPVGQGWNKLFEYLTEGVDIEYDYNADINNIDTDIIICTIPPDRFMNKETLPYIGYSFEIDSVLYDDNKPDTIIFPNDVPFISMSQYGKLFPVEDCLDNKNIIIKEFTELNSGDLAHPIITKENIKLYNSIVEEIGHIYLCGPLATYKNMSMAESIEEAQILAGKIKHTRG